MARASIPTVLTVAALALGAVVVAVASHGPEIAAGFVDAGRRVVLGVSVDGPTLYRTFWIAGALASGVAFTLVAVWQRRVTVADLVAGPIFVFGFVYGAFVEGRTETATLAEAARVVPTHLVGAGMRMPLGLMIGGVASLAFCRAVCASWRHAGDRLAIAAATWESVGRLGCLMAGCCTGTVCPAWLAWGCLRYPPRTGPFFEQMNTGLVDAASPWSHPVHVLPAYFALASVAFLVVAAWLLRRRVPAGMLLALYAIGYPLVKLGLESFRGTPRLGAMMPAVLLALLLLGLLSAPWGALVAARRRRGNERTLGASPGG